MNYKSLVSIIIPAYNAESYIKQCLKSILQQTYENLQIIVIDDGSMDNTYEICKSMQKFDNRIELYRQKNSGPSAARNVGLQHVKGLYLLFVDADDNLHLEAIEKLVEAMETEKADLVCFEWKIVQNGQVVEEYSYSEKEARANRKQIFDNVLLNDFLNGGGFLWNKMWRIAAIRSDTFISFDSDLKKYEDKLWILKNLLRCKKVIYVKDKLYYYHLFPNSLSHIRPSIESARQFFLASDRIVEFVRSDYPTSVKKAERWSRVYLAGLLFRGIREKSLTNEDIRCSKKYRIYQLPLGWKAVIHWVAAKVIIAVLY